LLFADNKKLEKELADSAEKSFRKEYTLERYTEKLIKFFDDAYAALKK
jgi:hypothetical protein